MVNSIYQGYYEQKIEAQVFFETTNSLLLHHRFEVALKKEDF